MPGAPSRVGAGFRLPIRASPNPNLPAVAPSPSQGEGREGVSSDRLQKVRPDLKTTAALSVGRSPSSGSRPARPVAGASPPTRTGPARTAARIDGIRASGPGPASPAPSPESPPRWEPERQPPHPPQPAGRSPRSAEPDRPGNPARSSPTAAAPASAARNGVPGPARHRQGRRRSRPDAQPRTSYTASAPPVRSDPLFHGREPASTL